ncbi:Thioredoxin reductase [Weissella viridescens]|uniref:Thioredoxin reductase n=1 Tax=Weissella viridescens TaxID=1629 RepID=A0A380NW45_WEIVI|nr:Thioredoxin reductase [Weissella viridescens]
MQSINGDGTKVTSVTLKNNVTDEVQDFATAATFIYIGLLPVSDSVDGLGITDDQGWILTNDQMETTQPGILRLVMFVKAAPPDYNGGWGCCYCRTNAYAYNETLKDGVE